MPGPRHGGAEGSHLVLAQQPQQPLIKGTSTSETGRGAPNRTIQVGGQESAAWGSRGRRHHDQTRWDVLWRGRRALPRVPSSTKTNVRAGPVLRTGDPVTHPTFTSPLGGPQTADYQPRATQRPPHPPTVSSSPRAKTFTSGRRLPCQNDRPKSKVLPF